MARPCLGEILGAVSVIELNEGNFKGEIRGTG